MHAQTFITWSTHRRQGNFLKKYNFLEFCIYNLVSLSGMEAGWAVVVVRLDSTMFDAQFTPKLLLPGLHRWQGNFLKKYNFLEFCIYNLVSLSGIQAGWAVVLVRLDTTMFDAQFTPKLLLPGLHIGGRGIFKKSTISLNFAFTMWLVFQEYKPAGRLFWYGWIAQCLTHNARPNFYYLVYT